MPNYCRCHLFRHNPDEQLRELERQARLSSDSADWDRYLASLDRAGILSETLTAIEGNLPPMGGKVSEEDAILLMRVLGYRFRSGVIDLKNLSYWETELIRQAILRAPRQSSSKMSSDLEGYFWIRYVAATWRRRAAPAGSLYGAPCDCPMETLLQTGCALPDFHLTQQFYPLRVFSSPGAKNRKYFHRIFLLCPVCQQEIPTGRLSQHFDSRSHRPPGAPT